MTNPFGPDPYAVDPAAKREADAKLRQAYSHDCKKCWREAGGRGKPRVFRCPDCFSDSCPKAADHANPCAAGEKAPQLVGGLKSGDQRTEAEAG